jgi:pilus assembly protein CpaF
MKLSERISAVQDRNQSAGSSVAVLEPPRPAAAPARTREGGTRHLPAAPAVVIPTSDAGASPVPSAPSVPKAQSVDVFAAMKHRAATALFERMGARFNDATATEQELRSTAKEELTRIIDAEQVPLTP